MPVVSATVTVTNVSRLLTVPRQSCQQRRIPDKDFILGHEVIGTIVAVGPGEKKWKEGDQVGGP